MARARIPVSVNGIEFDALISEDRSYQATVPEYATENGFSVTDAIILGEETVSMVLYITNTPVTWYEEHGDDNSRVRSVCQQLEDLFYEHTPVTVTTSEKTWTNMAIEQLTISKSLEVGYAREVPITFRKIRVTEATTTTIPSYYGKSGTTETLAGTANTTAANTSSSSKSSSSSSSSKSSSSSSSSSGGSSSGGSSSSSTKSSSSSSSGKSSILYSAGKSLGLVK